MRSNQAQVAVEFVLASLVIFMLLVASAKLFVWFSDTLVERQLAFEKSREFGTPATKDPNCPRTDEVTKTFQRCSYDEGERTCREITIVVEPSYIIPLHKSDVRDLECPEGLDHCEPGEPYRPKPLRLM